MAKKTTQTEITTPFSNLKSQNATASWGGRRSLPFAFTELGVAMLSSVLTPKEAIEVYKQIMRAFSAMRRFLVSNAQVFQRLENLEYKLIATDEKVALLFDKIEEGKLEPRQGIFFLDCRAIFLFTSGGTPAVPDCLLVLSGNDGYRLASSALRLRYI